MHSQASISRVLIPCYNDPLIACLAELVSPIQDPSGLAVSMKLSAAINRLAGAQ